MKTAVTSVFILSLLLSTGLDTVYAARVLPRFKKPGRAVSAGRGVSGGGVRITGKLLSGRRGINVYFRGLNNATAISYELSYTSEGEARGVVGSIDPASGSSVTRELLFGTCSAGVCRLDTGISNALLIVTSQRKDGRRSIKKFRIRV